MKRLNATAYFSYDEIMFWMKSRIRRDDLGFVHFLAVYISEIKLCNDQKDVDCRVLRLWENDDE